MRASFAAVLFAALLLAGPASGYSLLFDDGSGLSGTADFSLVDATTLRIVLTNTSTAPNLSALDPADNLLTSLAFQLPTGVSIGGGSAVIGAQSMSIGFDTGAYGAGTDVSGEWGYGNGGGTGFGSLVNYVSAMQAGTTPFGGPNLDSTAVLDGPQAGLAAPGWIAGGLGGIEDTVVVTLNLTSGVSDLSFLDRGALIEFGSDARFVPAIPEPTAVLVFAFGLLTVGGALRLRAR